MIHRDQFSKIIFNIDVDQENTSNLIEVRGRESEPRPKPELIESKSEPRTKPKLIESKSEPRSKPEHIESKPLIDINQANSKPEEENAFSMPIIEFGSGTEPSTSTSSRYRRNRGGY